jgi:rhodanese-related sulfurtransferase
MSKQILREVTNRNVSQSKFKRKTSKTIEATSLMAATDAENRVKRFKPNTSRLVADSNFLKLSAIGLSNRIENNNCSSTDDSSDSGIYLSYLNKEKTLVDDVDDDSSDLDDFTSETGDSPSPTNTNKLTDDEEDRHLSEFNKLLDLSHNSSVASNDSLLFQQHSRRCLFSTGSSSSSSKSPVVKPKHQQTTPISVLKMSSVTATCEVTSSLMDFSLHEIESCLSISLSRQEATAKQAMVKQVLLEEPAEDEEEEALETPDQLMTKHERIMNSLEIEYNSHYSCMDVKLIGDKSRCHILPCKSNVKHTDLSVIAPDTLKQLFDGVYREKIDHFVIIDSRYPYEYEGGHIRDAKNVYTKGSLVDMFLNTRNTTAGAANSEIETKRKKKFVVIFHCEFSSERGPSLLRFLRNQDRSANKDAYPKLFYPELYLLEGGYKAFYEKYPVGFLIFKEFLICSK